MRGKFPFFALLAAVIVTVLAISGLFGPLGAPSKNLPATDRATAQKAAALLGVTSPSVRWTSDVTPGNEGKLHIAFRVEASSPLQSLTLNIKPVTPLKTGLKLEQESRDVTTWLMGNKTIDWDGDIDFTGSLMAGRPVTVQIVATDEDHRTGTSEPIAMTLPEHRFSQPLAQALYNLRRGLQEDPVNRRNDALRALAPLLEQRATFENQDLALLTLRSAAVRIALDTSDEGVQSALDLLWHAALLFEDAQAGNVTLSLRMTPKPAAPASKPE